MYFATVTDEHVYRKYVKQTAIRQIHKGKIKVCFSVFISNHGPPICLRSTVINYIILRWNIKPSTFDLHLNQHAENIKNQIVGQIITNWVKNAPTSLQCF